MPPFFIRNRTHFEMNTIHRIELFNYSWRLASVEWLRKSSSESQTGRLLTTAAVTEWEIAITWVARLGQFPLLILISLLNGSNLIWKTNSTHNKPLGDHLEVASSHLLATDRHWPSLVDRQSPDRRSLAAASSNFTAILSSLKWLQASWGPEDFRLKFRCLQITSRSSSDLSQFASVRNCSSELN